MGQESSTSMAAEVAAIWAEVLGTDHIDEGANFFDLGGHSLLAIRVMARIEQRLGIDAPLAAVFQYPTPASFAAQFGPEGLPAEPPLSSPRAPSRSLETVLAEIDQLSNEEAAQLLALLESNTSRSPA